MLRTICLTDCNFASRNRKTQSGGKIAKFNFFFDVIYNRGLEIFCEEIKNRSLDVRKTCYMKRFNSTKKTQSSNHRVHVIKRHRDERKRKRDREGGTPKVQTQSQSYKIVFHLNNDSQLREKKYLLKIISFFIIFLRLPYDSNYIS